MTSTAGILVLESNTNELIVFEGKLVGAPLGGQADRGYGEVVFNTSLTGYQEILTDPSYYGQMVCMTAPHIGNTGINPEDFESKRAWCAGFILHDLTDTPSNWRSTQNLESFLNEQGVPALTGVDTRALTRHLRHLGVVRGLMLPAQQAPQTAAAAKKLFEKLPAFEGRDLINEVSTPTPYAWSKAASQASSKFRVVAMDFGIKWNLLRSLEARGCSVEVVPAKTPADDILKRNPDGIFLSNGPGDPSAAPYAVKTVKTLLGQVPVFGVCMGHQILSLALGGKTYKMKFGHRGGNQPVQDHTTGHVEISSHNHGYSVDARSLPKEVQVTHLNLNDQTVEGIAVPQKKAFSVQYHPEACPGPHDSVLLFDRFIELMRGTHKHVS